MSGNVSYTSYPIPYTTPNSGSFSLSSPPNPMILGIAAWSTYTGTWDLSGTSNFRWKWIGIGASPIKVRVSNSAMSKGLFSGGYTFDHNLTGVDNISSNSGGGDDIKNGGGYKNVDTDTVFQIGYTQSATVFLYLGTNGSGQFSWSADSSLAELSSAIRRQDGPTYHKLGDGPNQEVNGGDDYSHWVMDTVAAQPDIAPSVALVNILTGPWHKDTATYTWSPHSNFQETLEQKTAQFPSYSPQAWSALSTSPDQKTVTASVTDVYSSDQPQRTASIIIRIHNPYENWRFLRHSDGSPYETFFWKDPEEFQWVNGKSVTINGDEVGIQFKYRHSYPLMTHISDTITGKQPLLNALENFSPPQFKALADVATITVSTVAAAEAFQGPVGATFAGKWGDPNSTFDPPKDESLINSYYMTASVSLQYKRDLWKSDGYNETGYFGPVGGSTEQREAGQFVYGIFKIGAAGGGGITPGGGD